MKNNKSEADKQKRPTTVGSGDLLGIAINDIKINEKQTDPFRVQRLGRN